MNQKLKKHIIKSMAVFFSTTTFLTSTPHAFAWKFFPTAKNILYRTIISPERRQQLNENLFHIIYDNVSYDKNQINEIRSLLEVALTLMLQMLLTTRLLFMR